jgi:hypothetical protein
MNCIDKSIKTLEQAKSCCKKTYMDLDVKQKKYIDEFITACIAILAMTKPTIPSMLERANSIASSLTVDAAIKYIQFATSFLKQKEVVSVIEAYVDMYKGVVKDKRRLSAYAKYMQCVIEKLDSKYVKLINAVIVLMGVIFKLIANSEVTPALVDVIMYVHKHMIKPIVKTTTKKLKSRKPTRK